MKISATSALVLNWSSPELWQTDNAISYIRNLDVSEGNELLQLFSEEEHYMHYQTVSGRKYFVKKCVLDFLKNLKKENRHGQVLVLGAGIAPVSIEIASLFPSSTVFDIDKYLMNQKEKFVNGNPANIKFIECDITNIDEMNRQLLTNGFDPEKPSIVIMEGIIYYLSKEELLNIFCYFKKSNSVFACDFCLLPELVHPATQNFLTDVFKKISEHIKLDFVQFYSEEQIVDLFHQSNYENVVVTNMQQIQRERTGDEFPFTLPNSSWVELLMAK